jgi:hypothetical protein
LSVLEKAWIENDKVYCKVTDPNIFCSEVPRIAGALNLQMKSFQQMVGTLEEIIPRLKERHKNATKGLIKD